MIKSKFVMGVILVGAISFSGCVSSSPSWKVLGKQGVDSNLCSLKLKDKSEIEECNIKQLAAIRAKEECKKDMNPEYCVLMAEYSWNNFVDLVAKGKATKMHAERYPIMCGWRTEPRKLEQCSKL